MKNVYLQKHNNLEYFICSYDENQILKISSGLQIVSSSAFKDSKIINVQKVDRRTQKLRLEVQLENGIKVLNLSFYDVEKQDWSMEEKKYMEKVNLHKIA